MSDDPRMNFEWTMMLFFGFKKANNIAGSHSIRHLRNRWLAKALREMLKVVNELDTTPQHRQNLMEKIEGLRKVLKRADEPTWDMVFDFFNLCGRLLGFDSLYGLPTFTVMYTQTPEQYFRQKQKETGDYFAESHGETTAISIRKRIVKDMKAQGLDDFMIGLVFNTSESEVRKIQREETEYKKRIARKRKPQC